MPVLHALARGARRARVAERLEVTGKLVLLPLGQRGHSSRSFLCKLGSDPHRLRWTTPHEAAGDVEVRAPPLGRARVLHEAQGGGKVAAGARGPGGERRLGIVLRHEHALDLCRPEREEVHTPAPRHDRRQQVFWGFRDEHEDHISGGFLQHLQQRVRCGGIEPVRVLEEEDLHAPLVRRKVRVLTDGPYLIDQDLRPLRRDRVHVGMGAPQHARTHVAHAAAAVGAVERRRERHRSKLAAHTLWADEEVRVTRRAARDGVAEDPHGGLLPDQARPHRRIVPGPRAHVSTRSGARNGNTAARTCV